MDDKLQALKQEQIKRKSATHIFGIGFNRSGTSSLTTYLRDLGISTVHWKNGHVSKTMRSNAGNKKPLLTDLDHWKAYFDFEHYDPTQPLGYFKSYQKFFSILAASYPQALFIFHYRSCNSWIKSLFHHPIARHQLDKLMSTEKLDELFGKREEVLTIEYMQYVSKKTIYQLVEALRQEYKTHTEKVVEYFQGKGRLVIFHLEELEESMFRLNSVLEQINWKETPSIDNVDNGKNSENDNLQLQHLNKGVRRKLSIMICCMNRAEHLMQTLPKTLEDNLNERDHIEIVVVHFLLSKCKKEDDQLTDFIYQNCSEHLQSRYLKYICNRDFKHWQPGPCRHTAFWYTRGELVYNLDCDNFTGQDGGKQIIELFNLYGEDEIIYLGFNGVFGSGSFGRICLSEANHFKIGSYHYHLPTKWAHDDSFLLLQSLFILRLRILVPDKTNCLHYLKELLRGIEIEDNEELMKDIAEYGLVEASLLNPHEGIIHDRSDSFKTVEGDTVKALYTRDLRLGFDYINRYFNKGKKGKAEEDLYRLVNYWKDTDNIAGEYFSNSCNGKEFTKETFNSLEDYEDYMRHQKFIFYTVMKKSEELDLVINLFISGVLNKILMTVLVDKTVYQKEWSCYPVIWLLVNEETLAALYRQHILIKMNYQCVIINRVLPTRINKLLNQFSHIDTFADKNRALLVKKSSTSFSIHNFDFVGNRELVLGHTREDLVAEGYWFTDLIKNGLVIWGDPTDTVGLNIGPNELERRRSMQQKVDSFASYCQNLGMTVKKRTDKDKEEIKEEGAMGEPRFPQEGGMGEPRFPQEGAMGEPRSRSALFPQLTFGLFAFNNRIPINDKTVYLIWQPDQAFDISRFPIERTLVIAYRKKTSYKTFIIDDSINYLELFRSISSIGR